MARVHFRAQVRIPVPVPVPVPAVPGNGGVRVRGRPRGATETSAQGTRGRPREPRSDALRVETAVATREDLERVAGLERGVTHGALVGDVRGGRLAPVLARVFVTRRRRNSRGDSLRLGRCGGRRGAFRRRARRVPRRVGQTLELVARETSHRLRESRARLRVEVAVRVVPPRSTAGVHAVDEASQSVVAQQLRPSRRRRCALDPPEIRGDDAVEQ